MIGLYQSDKKIRISAWHFLIFKFWLTARRSFNEPLRTRRHNASPTTLTFEKIGQQKWFLELIEDAFGILKLFELGLGT